MNLIKISFLYYYSLFVIVLQIYNYFPHNANFFSKKLFFFSKKVTFRPLFHYIAPEAKPFAAQL